MPTETERFEAEGANALTTLKAALKGMDFDDKEVCRAAVEVDVKKPEPETGTEEPPSNGDDDSGRQLKKARKDTLLHAALHRLSQADQPIPTDEAAERFDLSKQQFSSEFSRGHRRMLVERERREDGKSGYKYRLSEHGKAELKRLGAPERDK